MSTRTARLDVHPALDVPLLRDLIHPDRPLWTPRELRDLTRTVAAELTTELLSVVEFHPEQRWWARLALTRGVELWLLSWTPGQGTEPHDHGGASGSFSVLLGALGEDYRYPGGPIRSGRHQVGAAIGFGPNRAHQVRNTGRVNAASVHAYSPPLLPVREYPSLLDVPDVPVPRPAAEDVLGQPLTHSAPDRRPGARWAHREEVAG
ncbi:Cysteine dioxygenase type I [Streptoalloteichus tenebrarius]|uniref:Cysteine dioxygenase type I n=1 Tax=Streptoalloteichus tenebrarius (strain ATCC 17920 / DSM 40477 / JCM 4838 / CBS 697.72 / NBRC 16177 / NCIMB 11028 / NRRL B-12390 / A12253. 1 / ISP 5477) TaxID=1933 RepID=A0ABT1HWX2_STRSD|nr:cysteine dioxygenase family protein [Streptoalloteichus tenebrarius]MCP2259895.1 Cysteine dioxygenase type I [Streptoalloteichus tenebrarius]BFF03220.1 cysteine dioxygenase family protein [Streptoalloteichus tenebrarius]